jgi:tetratricopeptide (TPR) repeat protein
VNLKLNSAKVLVPTIVLTAVLVTVLVLVALKNNEKSGQPIDRKKLNALNEQGNCRKTIDQLAKMKVSNKDQEGNIALLSFRASCYYQLQNYDKALSDYKQLHDIYQQTNDDGITSVNVIIKEIKGYIAHPETIPKNSSNPDLNQMSPEFQKQIQAENGRLSQ